MIIILIIVAVASGYIYKVIQDKDTNYEIEQVKQYNYFILKQNDKYGVMDRKGNIMIAPDYSEVKIPNPERGVFVCYQEDNTKILNEKAEEILTQYQAVQPIRLKNITSDLMYEKSVFTYEKDGKYGLVNWEGKEITKPIYEDIDSLPYKEGELLVKQEGKYGVITIKGKVIVEMQYDKISVDGYYTNENRYQFAGYIVSLKTQEGYRYGYYNYKGKEMLRTEYNDISRVTEVQENDNSYLICAKNGQYGIIKNEEPMIDNVYQSIRYDTTNKVFVVERSKKYGITNLEGQLMIPVQYNQIDITGNYLYAQSEKEVKVFHKDGTEANIDPNIAILDTDQENYKIRISNEDKTKYGVIDEKGNTLIQDKYNYIEYLYDNYFIVSNENGRLGIIDDKEDIKVEINKNSLQKIQDTDLIQTTLAENKTIQIYAKTMEKICEMQNATVEVEDNYIKIYNENEVKYFDKQGKKINNIEAYPNNKLFVKVKDRKYGFVDANGSLIVDYQYDKAYELNDYGFAPVRKNGKWGVINEEGKEVIAPTYEFKEQSEPFFVGRYYRVMYGLGEFYYTDAK